MCVKLTEICNKLASPSVTALHHEDCVSGVFGLLSVQVGVFGLLRLQVGVFGLLRLQVGVS